MIDEAAAALVAGSFGLGDPTAFTGPVAAGEQGDIYRLATGAGVYAVKEMTGQRTDTEIEVGARFNEAACLNGVPSPEVIRCAGGALIADIGGRRIRVHKWVDLRPPDILLDPVAVGSILAAIHRVEFDGPMTTDPWYSEPVGEANWRELDRALGDSGAPFAGAFAEMLEELMAMDTWVRPSGHLIACHRDLWADNLRSRVDGAACVIDWEDCGLADPGDELGCLLLEFAGDDPTRARALNDAYRNHGGPGRITGPGSFSMAIAQLGHILEISCRRWLADPSPVSRRHNEERFAEFVDRPFDRAKLLFLLDEVSG